MAGSPQRFDAEVRVEGTALKRYSLGDRLPKQLNGLATVAEMSQNL